MSELDYNAEDENSFTPFEIPINLEWTFDQDVAQDLERVDVFTVTKLFSKFCQIPGFGGLFYHIGAIRHSDVLSFFLSFYTENTRYNLYASLEFDYSFRDFPGLKKEFYGNLGNRTDDEDTGIELFQIPYNDWIDPDFPLFNNNQMRICVEGHIFVNDVYYYRLELPNDLWHKYYDLVSAPEDFVIVAENKEIKVHKQVLQERSTYFEALFSGGQWEEVEQNRLTIPDLPYHIVKIAIESLYHGIPLDRRLKKIDYLQLYEFAERHDIDMLKEAIKNSINFLPYNIVEYSNMAVEKGFVEFQEWCVDYMILCADHGYRISDIAEMNEEVQTKFVQEFFAHAKIDADRSEMWQHICHNVIDDNF